MADTVTVAVEDVHALAQFMSGAVASYPTVLVGIDGFARALDALARMEHAPRQPDQMPADPVPSGATLAIALHEQMLEYERADFTHDEAFELAKMHGSAIIQIGAVRTLHG